MSHWYVCTDNSIGIEGAKALSQCLSHLTKLSHLNLSCECVHRCITWCVMPHWWSVMCVSTVNYIGIEGAKALSQCLTHLTQLTHLDLSSEYWCLTWCVWCMMYDATLICTANTIGVEGASALSQCLHHLTQLTHLDLRSECVYWFMCYLVWCVCEREMSPWYVGYVMCVQWTTLE